MEFISSANKTQDEYSEGLNRSIHTLEIMTGIPLPPSILLRLCQTVGGQGLTALDSFSG